MTDKVIPILPCVDIKVQVAFYQLLGFKLTGLYTSPNPYASLQLGAIDLHFYGTRKVAPAENPSMCYLSVGDVDAVYNAFASALKKHTGKVPRSGIPRISKVRDLSNDRRFTLTDTGGNTIFVGSHIKSDDSIFFRNFQNEEYAQRLTVLYDIIYSKEDPALAESMLPRYAAVMGVLNDLDKAKYLLLTLEIQRQLNRPVDDGMLKSLMKAHKDDGSDWRKVESRYALIIQED
jgi:hypothetical protein